MYRSITAKRLILLEKNMKIVKIWFFFKNVFFNQSVESSSFVEKILQLEREGKNQNVDARDKSANAVIAAKNAKKFGGEKVETLQKILQQQG